MLLEGCEHEQHTEHGGHMLGTVGVGHPMGLGVWEACVSFSLSKWCPEPTAGPWGPQKLGSLIDELFL